MAALMRAATNKAYETYPKTGQIGLGHASKLKFSVRKGHTRSALRPARGSPDTGWRCHAEL